MSVRLATVLMSVLLPACASCLASPIGVLVGPFAGQVLAQQRQEAVQGKTAERKPTQSAGVTCQADRDAKRTDPATAAKQPCETAADDAVAVRTRVNLDPLPQPDKKSTAN